MANDGLNLWPVIFSVDIMRSIDSVKGQVATELTSSRLKGLNPFPSALVKEVKHYYIRQSSFARANFHSGYLPFHGAVPVTMYSHQAIGKYLNEVAQTLYKSTTPDNHPVCSGPYERKSKAS